MSTATGLGWLFLLMAVVAASAGAVQLALFFALAAIACGLLGTDEVDDRRDARQRSQARRLR